MSETFRVDRRVFKWRCNFFVGKRTGTALGRTVFAGRKRRRVYLKKDEADEARTSVDRGLSSENEPLNRFAAEIRRRPLSLHVA